MNIDETIVSNESDDVSSCKSVTSDWNEICESLLTSSITTNSDKEESINCLKKDSFKSDPAAAKEFLLLGSYQLNIKFPKTNHRVDINVHELP